MLHLVYVVAFTIIAFIAVSNLIRSLINISTDPRPGSVPRTNSYTDKGHYGNASRERGSRSVPHPEFLDDKGKVIDEPLLVMRSLTVEDARAQLDALYNASPSKTPETDEEA